MLLDRTTYQKLKKANYAEMLIFLKRFYEEAYEAGANADVDDSVKYIAIKEGTEYICGCCGAKLEFETEGENNDKDN